MSESDTATDNPSVESTSTVKEDDKREVRDLSIGKIVAYLVGGFTILAAIPQFTEGNAGAAIVLLVAGAFGFPPVRTMIEDELRIKMSRWLATLIYLALLMLAGGLGTSGTA